MKKILPAILTVLICGICALVTTSDATVKGKDSYGYTVTDSLSPAPSTNFLWVDASSGSSYTLIDEQEIYFGLVNNRQVYGNGFNASYVSDNGFLTGWWYPDAGFPYYNTPLPNKDLQDVVVIAPFWDDLVPKATSRIYHLNTTYQGSNVSVIEWYNFAHFDDPSASITFEAILFQNSNRIKFQYFTSTGTFADGSSATIGIQNLYAYENNQFFQYSYNTASVTGGLAIEFDMDSDGDWLSNGLETRYSTNQANADTDGGGVGDGAEIRAGTNPTAPADDAFADSDGDSVANQFELLIGSNPNAVDSDGDGLSDGAELFTFSTSLIRADTDGDGLNDGAEVGYDGILSSLSSTNLTAAVANGASSIFVGNTSNFPSSGSAVIAGNDTFTYTGKTATSFYGIPASGDNAVFAHGSGPNIVGDTNPLNRDTDGDGFEDGHEVQYGSDPRNQYSFPGTLVSKHLSTAEDYTRPSIVADRDRNIHVTYFDWSSWSSIYYSMLGPTGNILIPQVTVKTDSAYDSSSPEIVTTNDGKVVIVYQSTRSDDWYSWDLQFIKLEPNPSSGTATILEHKKIGAGQFRHPTIAKDSEGNIHIAYQSGGQWYTETKGVGYMKIDANGNVLAGPKDIYMFDTYYTHHKLRPSIVADTRGNVHIIWRHANRNDDTGFELYYTRLDTNGATLIPPTTLGFDPGRSHMAVWKDKVYIVATRCEEYNGNSYEGLYMAILDGSQDTVKFSLPFTEIVNSYGEWIVHPNVAVDLAGNAHVGYSIEDWHEYVAVDQSGAVIAGPTYVDPYDYYHISAAVSWETAYLAYYYQVPIEGNCCGSGIYVRSFATAQVPSAPTVASITPGRVTVGYTPVEVTISGSEFQPEASAAIGGQALTEQTVKDTTTITGTLGSGLSTGTYDVVVTNTYDGQSGTLAQGFVVAGGGGDGGCGCFISNSGNRASGGIFLMISAAIATLVLRKRIGKKTA